MSEYQINQIYAKRWHEYDAICRLGACCQFMIKNSIVNGKLRRIENGIDQKEIDKQRKTLNCKFQNPFLSFDSVLFLFCVAVLNVSDIKQEKTNPGTNINGDARPHNIVLYPEDKSKYHQCRSYSPAVPYAGTIPGKHRKAHPRVCIRITAV